MHARTRNRPLPSHKMSEEVLASPAQAVLQHITKVKLETQEKIFALRHEMQTLTKSNQEQAQRLADYDEKLQSKQVRLLFVHVHTSRLFFWAF